MAISLNLEEDSVLELLTRLTPRSMPLDSGGRTQSALQTTTEVAFALAQVQPPGAQALLRYLYVGQNEVLPQLMEHACHEFGPRYRWVSAGDAVYAPSLIQMRVAELRHGFVCPECLGTAMARQEAKLVECPACKGTGRVKPTEKSRAERFGVARSTWYKRWLPYYEDVAALLNDWVAAGTASFKRSLRNQ